MNELPSIILNSLKSRGIKELRPPQKLSLEKGVLDGKSLVISSPTSSGKTLVAEFAMINHFKTKGKTLYIVPLKSLASEKYSSFKKRYSEFGVKVAMSIGDFDKQDRYLNSYDIIITTSEKADSLIRHNAGFLQRVSCIIVDEVHLMDDAHRGPTLEVLLTILKQMLPKAQIIALSATISNDKELSEWLNAELVESDYRPVELHEGVFFNDEFIFQNHSYKTNPYKGNEETILKDTLEKKKQIIYFVSSRRNAQGLAKRLARVTIKRLSESEKSKLSIIADKVLYSLERPTEQCRLISELIRKGAAFHHAGLVQKQKKIIEDAFKDKLIKVICATPTLAAGINMPAFRVVVRDLTRFSQSQGSYFLPVLEVKQMFGRAGRPGFEEYGEALAIAKKKKDVELIFKEYINGEVESIYSKLGVEPALRTHVLSLISNRFCSNESEVKNFFKKTFFAKQYSNLSQLNLLIENIISLLLHFGFVEKEGEFLSVTQLGKRVCELYLDPLVADNLIQCINTSKRIKPGHFNVFQALCFAGEVRLLRIKNLEVNDLIKTAESNSLLIDTPNPFSYEYDSYLKSVKTALLFESWINEESEQSITENFRVFPGDLRNYIYTIDWLLYATSELASILSVKNIIGVAKRLRTRVAYGIRDELFSLVSIKSIGRARARKLYNNGIQSFEDVMNTPTKKLAGILGPGIAKKIKEI